jgi:hypothetical protein
MLLYATLDTVRTFAPGDALIFSAGALTVVFS